MKYWKEKLHFTLCPQYTKHKSFWDLFVKVKDNEIFHIKKKSHLIVWLKQPCFSCLVKLVHLSCWCHLQNMCVHLSQFHYSACGISLLIIPIQAMCTTLNINTTFFKRQTDLLSLTQLLVSHTYKAWRYARPFSL